MISNIRKFEHAGNGWSVQDLIGMTKQVVRSYELQSEYVVPLDLVRKLYNMSVSNIQELLLANNKDYYNVIFTIQYNLTTDIKNRLLYLDMNDIGITPNFLWGKRTHTKDTLNLTGAINRIETVYNETLGSFLYKTPDEIISLNTDENRLYSQSCIWSRSGNYLLLYFGDTIYNEIMASSPEELYVNVKAIRNPVLDDLKMPYEKPFTWKELVDNHGYSGDISLYSETYYADVDLPNQYISLVLLEMKKNTFETLSQPIPEALENKIQALIQSLQTNMQKEVTDEQIKSEKEN